MNCFVRIYDLLCVYLPLITIFDMGYEGEARGGTTTPPPLGYGTVKIAHMLEG